MVDTATHADATVEFRTALRRLARLRDGADADGVVDAASRLTVHDLDILIGRLGDDADALTIEQVELDGAAEQDRIAREAQEREEAQAAWTDRRGLDQPA